MIIRWLIPVSLIPKLARSLWLRCHPHNNNNGFGIRLRGVFCSNNQVFGAVDQPVGSHLNLACAASQPATDTSAVAVAAAKTGIYEVLDQTRHTLVEKGTWVSNDGVMHLVLAGLPGYVTACDRS
jgi:hypothetical protein